MARFQEVKRCAIGIDENGEAENGAHSNSWPPLR
jgi:hypothetical protein